MLIRHQSPTPRFIARATPGLLALAWLLAGCAGITTPAATSAAATAANAARTPSAAASEAVATDTPTSAPPPLEDVTTRLAWFYKPPGSGRLEAVAQGYRFFILTRMDERERDELRRLGAEGPILQYLLFSEVQDPGSCLAQPFHNQVAEEIGDFCALREEHADWFLRGEEGEPLGNDDGYVLMDPGSVGWRDYWLARARLSQESLGWQGVFLDNVEASLSKRREYGGLPAAYPDDASYQAAVEANLRFLYTSYFQPQGRPLFANIIALEDAAVWYRYLEYLDGAMIENFAAGWRGEFQSAPAWEAQMALAEGTQSLGKQVLLVCQGDEFDAARETFCLASYLLVNHGAAYFRYSSAAAYDEDWRYDNTTVELGPALGGRYQAGSRWVRDFERARVWVDPEAHTAGIEPRE